MEEKPTYCHHCESCRFIGTWKELHHRQDLYLCVSTDGRVSPQIVVVRNGDPSDTYGFFLTGVMPIDRSLFPAAAWGVDLARSKGML